MRRDSRMLEKSDFQQLWARVKVRGFGFIGASLRIILAA
jgi:hypothetical protein